MEINKLSFEISKDEAHAYKHSEINRLGEGHKKRSKGDWTSLRFG